MKKIALLIIGAFIAAIITCTCGCPDSDTESEPYIDANSLLEYDISPSANVEWRTHCLACGHTYIFTSSENVIGLNKTELARRYPSWEITTFSRELVILSRVIDWYCPEHCLLYLMNDRLVIYSITEPNLDMLPMLSMNASAFSFAPSTADKLRSGIPFNSLREIDVFLSKEKQAR